MSLLDEARKRAAELQALGLPMPTDTGGIWQPNPNYTGDASNPGMFMPNTPAPALLAAPAPIPPQLRQQAPSAADFANRQSPELAQLQAAMGQMQQSQQPAQQQSMPMRGMMQNGLFAGASGGLPAQAKQTPGMNPMQLMQMLSQTGLMGGAGGGAQ